MALGSTLFRLRLTLPAAALVLLVSVAAVQADVITKTDGSSYTGTILRETPATVEVEVEKYGAKFTMKIPRTQIRSIKRGDVAEPDPVETTAKPAAGDDADAKITYYPLPITGRLGEETQAGMFASALDDVLAVKPNVLVLYIDSTGGATTEADQIIQLLKKTQEKSGGLRIVAYVRRAQAAAAAVALWCPDVCIDSTGTILAAETPTQDPNAVRDAAETINVAIVDAAKHGKHDELLVRGLIDPELQLAVSKEEGKVVIREGRAGLPLSEKGKALTLTGKQAMEAGLAKGVADSVYEMKTSLGIEKWRKVDGKGWAMLSQQAIKYRREADKAKLEAKREEAKQRQEEMMARIGPELAKIDQQITAVKERGRAAEGEKATLARSHNETVTRANRTYEQTVRRLSREDSHYHTRVRQARQTRDQSITTAENRNRPRAQKIQSDINAAVKELRDLQARRAKLLKGAKKK